MISWRYKSLCGISHKNQGTLYKVIASDVCSEISEFRRLGVKFAKKRNDFF